MGVRKILDLAIAGTLLGATGATPIRAEEPAITPKVVARYLVGTWGLRASESDYEWFEVASRCGRVSGAISQPVDKETQQQIEGVIFDKRIGGGTSIKGMLAFGQKEDNLAVISRFKNDTIEEMYDDSVKPKIAEYETLTATDKPMEFLIGKVPGLIGKRTIRLVSENQFILLADPKTKGGFGGGVPDREFHRCMHGEEHRDRQR